MHFDAQAVIQGGMRVLVGFVILLVAHVAGKTVERRTIALGDREGRRDVTIAALGHILYFSIMFSAFMVILRFFGVEIASVVAIISAIGFAIGLSLQGSLSDIASGILITFFKIFDIGDVIQVGETEGKVLDFRLIHTVLEDLNTKAILTVPNRTLQSSVVSNITKQGYHYFIVDMLVSNSNKDFAGILNMIRRELRDARKFPMILQNIPHRVSVADMGRAGTVLRTRVPMTTEADAGERSSADAGGGGTADVAVKRGDYRNALRSVLEANGVALMNPTSVASQ